MTKWYSTVGLGFQQSAAFGKRIEQYVIALMIKEGPGVYIPMVDDDSIDAVVKRPDGACVVLQIKARSRRVSFGDAALCAAIRHEPRDNYWFLAYSETLDRYRSCHRDSSSQNRTR